MSNVLDLSPWVYFSLAGLVIAVFSAGFVAGFVSAYREYSRLEGKSYRKGNHATVRVSTHSTVRKL